MDDLSCLIDNAGNMDMQSVTAAKTLSVSDSLLNVIVVRDASIGFLISIGKQISGQEPKPGAVEYWQEREISIVTDPSLVIQGDGEM